MRRLPLTVERKIAKSAVSAGANPILAEARRLVPTGDEFGGTLKRSLRKVVRSRKTADAMVSVVTRSGKRWTQKGMNAFYAGKVEFGVPAYGIPARPFMRTALRTQSAAAIQAISKKITERIHLLANGK